MRIYTNKHLKRSRVHHDARTIPVKGTGEDAGKWFKCWTCGFICNSERDSLGGAESMHGMSSEFYYEYYPQSEGAYRGVSASSNYLHEEGETSDGTVALATLAVLRGKYRTSAVGMDGNPIQTKLTYAARPERGCPLCGSTNWRGDYR
jgi:hypothetical protein